MSIKSSTLMQFESLRKKDHLIPPLQSNSFYTVGNGEINIFCLRNNEEDYRFDLNIYNGNVYTGAGNFVVSGDIVDIDNPYRNLSINKDTSLFVTQGLTISSGEMTVIGNLELMKHSRLFVRGKGKVIFDSTSRLIVNNSADIIVEKESTLIIYGKVDIDISRLNSITNNPNIIIDSAAVLNVTGINFDNKEFSLVQYEYELKQKDINTNTQGEKNYDYGKSRIGYRWRDGKPLEHSHAIDITLLLGEIVLGDLRLSVTGLPDKADSKSISNLIIKKYTTLYITENYKNSTYMRPELYVGVTIGNNKTPASCTIGGVVICDGENTMITVDRHATLTIEEGGELHLRNGAIMRSAYNDNTPVLFINGTVTIEDISQIKTFEKENVVFGPNGKLIILNPDTGQKRLLFTTPNGILNSDLYRIFIDDIDHIEYHISNNTGIGIDQYYEFYSREMTNWFGNRRIEKAIYDKILIWHDGGFIELYNHITPWADLDSTLLHASRIFKTFGSFDEDKLQDAANRLTYAGCGNILFRFIKDDEVKEVMLTLKAVHMRNIFNDPLIGKYVLNTDNDGSLFLRNYTNNASVSELINKKSKIFEIVDNKVEFIV